MIKEALDRIIALADPATVLVYEDPYRKIYLREGEEISVEKPSMPRDHKASDVATVISLANRFAAESESLPAVFFNEAKVIALLKDGIDESRERVTLSLEFSAQFKLLRAINSGTWFDQKAFIRFLRIELAGALATNVLLEKVRKIKFENGVVTTGNVGRQQESLGRIQTSSTTSLAGDLPEVVQLSVPVYANPGELDLYPVDCAIDDDAKAEKFQLIPLAGQLDRAVQLAVGSIAQRLSQDLTAGIPFYHGSP